MKTLSNYIKESINKSQNSQNSHFEEFVDEETGKLYKYKQQIGYHVN